ncbi:MAG: hypothetical protein ISR64_10200 [Deltaproteobacteria bacterium]|nr:hypothetical protein [Deltaproteobacteria bacterium]
MSLRLVRRLGAFLAGDRTVPGAVAGSIWSIGPGIWAAAITVLGQRTLTADQVHRRVPRELGIQHVTVEIRHEEDRN